MQSRRAFARAALPFTLQLAQMFADINSGLCAGDRPFSAAQLEAGLSMMVAANKVSISESGVTFVDCLPLPPSSIDCKQLLFFCIRLFFVRVYCGSMRHCSIRPFFSSCLDSLYLW